MRLPMRFVAILAIAILVTACAEEQQQAAYTSVSNAQLKELLAKGIPLVDIRRPEEWRQTGVIEGSHTITLFGPGGQIHQDFFDKLARIAPRDKPVALICRTGNRTRVASDYLTKKLGYTQVYNVKHGITDWIRKGNPVVKHQP